MKMKVTRRDLLALAGGSAVGLALSPAPWKFIDDLSIWTQNWKWIPRPPKGPISTKMTRCSLCPAGCAMEARCVGAYPVSLRAATPNTTLCSLGLTAHHLPYHPTRFAAPMSLRNGRRVATTTEKVVHLTATAISEAIASGKKVAVLDMRPGRSTSVAWQHFLAATGSGVMIAAPGREGASLGTLDAMLAVAPGTCALDLEHAQTIVSFGAPAAEGWGSPATAARLVRKERRQQWIQIEPNRSKTADLATTWIPVRPGTEGALALSIAHVLLAENLVRTASLERVEDFADYKAIAAQFNPALSAHITGVPASRIVALAREMARCRPALSLAGEDPGSGRFDRATESAIFGLNILAGNIDQQGGVLRRRPLPQPFDEPLARSVEIDEVPDSSLAVLIIDASEGDALFPWPLVQRKLVPRGGLVIALSPFLAGTAVRADYVVPTLPILESIHEITGAGESPRSTFGVSAPLLQPKEGAIDPVAFIAAVAAARKITIDVANGEETMKRRAAAILAAGRGSVLNPADGSTSAVTSFESADALWEALVAGGLWIDDAPDRRPDGAMTLTAGLATHLKLLAVNARPTNARRQLAVLARAPRDVAASAAISPVFTKLYQESGLRRPPMTAALNPNTIAELSLTDGHLAHLETAAGSVAVSVAADHSIMPGVVEVTLGPNALSLGQSTILTQPDALDLLGPDADGIWRFAAATLVEG